MADSDQLPDRRRRRSATSYCTRVGVMRARQVERMFAAPRKHTHWGRRSASTGNADIKLNTRLSLRAPTEKIASRTGYFRRPTVAKPSVKTFSGRRSCLKQGIGLMIRYSSYAGTNYRTNQSAPTKLLCSLAIEYRELQDLRERVRIAEAAARNAPRDQKNRPYRSL